MASEGGNIEVCSWLKSMPVAPEYHPTLAEFQDPIGYIFKIEKEASKYGICKIVPPVSAPSKKSIITNFNKSLLARSTDPKLGPTFTTRQQQVGFCPRKHRPVRKPVWQSGERYTLSEFEAKAKMFERGYLRKYVKKVLSALDIETLYWNATVDKPFSVEYANDMPGSAFVEKKSGGKRVNESVGTVADTEWNMRGVSRSNISLLRFMKEEIPGVTSPMVYVAMMFSWFAWHVEDHDLHSLNYLHMGAGKTWYGVPKEAAVAFEEVIREHGYSGEINPLVTFATLGEKTTVMSPEVLINAGVPCCRLVQNAGDFVVTFPRAYHSGFSHGFNCGEASNIATPEWLRFAKEAAIRRASINCPPMVSHFQLLYDLALSLCSRVPKNISTEPRSSRLKDKRKCEGEVLIKELFVQDMMQNNDMLHILGKGSSIVLLPRNTLTNSNSQAGLQLTAKSRLFPSLCGPDLARDEFVPERMKSARDYADTGKVSMYPGNNTEQNTEMKKATQCKQGLFSCVTCGILCFSCVAIMQPTEAASRYLMSADCDILNDDLGVSSDEHKYNVGTYNPNTNRISVPKQDALFNIPISCTSKVQNIGGKESVDVVSKNSNALKGPSSLGLLALAYGISSDSDDDGETEIADIPVKGGSESSYSKSGNPGINCGTHVSRHISSSNATSERATWSVADSGDIDYSDEFRSNTVVASNSLTMSFPSRSNQDSSRLHVFCLEHAMQVEERLSSVGGANVVLICHPEYPKLESQARKVSEELEKDCVWSKVSFREATDRDEDVIQLALESENAIHGNGDWAVKLGINLFYSASLSRSPLYCKQMPYNSVIYSAFGRNPPSENQFESEGKVLGRQKKIVVAGKWCGKVWMSTQAHPLLINKDSDENDLEFCKVPRSKPRLINQDVVINSKPSRKRKIMEVNDSSMRGKSPEAEETSESYRGFAKSHSRKPIKRKRGSKPPLKKMIAHSDDDMDESSEEFQHNSRKQVKCRFGNERLLKETSDAENSESSSDEFPSWKQNISKNKVRCTEDEYSEESEEEPPLNNNWKQNLGKNKARLSEDEYSEESEEEHSLNNLWKQNMRKNTARRMKYDSSEESEEESPLSNHWKQISCKNQGIRTKRDISPEAEEESSEEFQPSNSRKRPNVKRGTPKQVKKKIPPAETLSESSGELILGDSWKRTTSRGTKPESPIEDELEEGGPSSRLRRRPKKPTKISEPKSAKSKQPKAQKEATPKKGKYKEEEAVAEYLCDMEGCGMSFSSKQELLLHKRNICPVRGCGKKFFSHKYLVQHRRVHIDDRPLKCPWKGCKMTFKWAWARTEHIRVHTGARPYICTQAGCGQTFRFVSDFSRHKRKTGHNPKKVKV